MHTRDEASKILDTHMSLLGEPFTVAWGRWLELQELAPELQRHLTPRARANVVYDAAAARATTIFSGMAPDVTVHDAHGFLLLVFEGQLHLRLKKFRNGGLTTSGIPTQQQLDFAAQQPLPGMPKATNVVLGYQLDAFQTRIERMAITCSTLGKRHWLLDVPQPGGAVVQPIKPEGITPPTIRSKREEEETERQDSEGS